MSTDKIKVKIDDCSIMDTTA